MELGGQGSSSSPTSFTKDINIVKEYIFFQMLIKENQWTLVIGQCSSCEKNGGHNRQDDNANQSAECPCLASTHGQIEQIFHIHEQKMIASYHKLQAVSQ